MTPTAMNFDVIPVEIKEIIYQAVAHLGSYEPQLISHAVANMRIGDNKNFLIKIISQCLPFIGYPSRCVNEAAKNFEEAQK